MSAKKSSAEKVEIKSKKRKSAIKEKPAKARQENSQKTARKKSLEKIKPDHQVKIQKALYEIADAASAVKDMQSFYKKLQKIIGKLMYAGSFFIASYDAQTGIVSWPYYLDEAGDISPEPMLLDETKGGTAYVIRTGKVLYASRDLDRLIKRGEMRVEGTRPVDAIGIPLKEGDTILGALAIQSYSPGILYTEEDVRVLTFVAQHIATALTRARAIEETRQRNAELAIINSVQEGLIAQLDFNAIIHLVGKKLYEIFKVSTVQINIYDSATNMVHTPYCFEEGNLHSHEPRVAAGRVKQLLDNKQTLIINENFLEEARKEGFNNPPAGKFPKSAVNVPLVVKDQARGYISLQDNDHEHTFTESVVRLVTLLANSMSVALENARLFDETQRLFKAEQERVAELAIINAVQGALAAELDIQGIYDAVGDKLVEIFNNQDVSIYTANLVAHTMTVEYTFEKGQKQNPVTVPLNSLYQYVVNADKTLVFNGNLPEFAAQFKDYKNPGGELPKSILLVPIPHKKEATERVSLTLQDVDGNTVFTDSHVRLLETLAASMSVALQNAQSFKAEQERVAELQIINSIQQGLAAELDFQAIVDLVGDKLREVFNTPDLMITWYDEKANLVHYLYFYEHGKRLTAQSQPPNPGGIYETEIKTRKPLVLNNA